MSTAQERREKKAGELIPRKYEDASNIASALSNQLYEMFRKVGHIYYHVIDMYAIAKYLMYKMMEVWSKIWFADAPVDKGIREELTQLLDNLEKYREKVYKEYKEWLLTFIDEDSLKEGRGKYILIPELPRLALFVLDSLEDMQGQIQELKKRIETEERFVWDDVLLAMDIHDNAYTPVGNLPQLAYWYVNNNLIEFLQKQSPELFQSK